MKSAAPDMNPWPGATGLAEDVRRYGHWMREEAKKGKEAYVEPVIDGGHA